MNYESAEKKLIEILKVAHSDSNARKRLTTALKYSALEILNLDAVVKNTTEERFVEIFRRNDSLWKMMAKKVSNSTLLNHVK